MNIWLLTGALVAVLVAVLAAVLVAVLAAMLAALFILNTRCASLTDGGVCKVEDVGMRGENISFSII